MANQNKCCPDNIETSNMEKCDIFHFMANVVGLTVLHPGGFKATDELAELCKISKDTHILDIACGKGTSAYYFAKKFGCQVTGFDISEDLINQAKKLAERKGFEAKLNFKVANAENLPFSDNSFDVSIFQAVLILVENKKQAIKEAVRVTKPGGYIGFLEMTWQKQPTESFLKEAAEKMCPICIGNIRTYEGWKELIFNQGLKEVITKKYKMRNPNLIKDEGISNAVKVMSKWLFNPRIRNRMNEVDNLFEKYSEYFGYGIYVGQKSG
ncbi:MAG: class I SAM-dependent methyltransferase [Nitrospirota bacterium]